MPSDDCSTPHMPTSLMYAVPCGRICASAVCTWVCVPMTADETILEHGTAYLTDAGMCGPAVGVLGREREPIIQRFRTSMPAKFPVANWPVRLCGAVVQVDEATGRALNIARISKIVEKPAS